MISCVYKCVIQNITKIDTGEKHISRRYIDGHRNGKNNIKLYILWKFDYPN